MAGSEILYEPCRKSTEHDEKRNSDPHPIT